MIHIVLCDDNTEFICLLRSALKDVCKDMKPSCDISTAFTDGKAVLAYLKERPADIVFLDIDMPGMTGLEVAKILCLEHPDIKIVFVSAYDEFVYTSFEYYPFAYLRKNYLMQELPKLMRRVSEKANEDTRRILIPTISGEKSIDIKHVSYIQSNHNYADAVIGYMKPTATDCIYIAKTLSHSSTFTGELLVSLKTRTKLVIAPTIVPPRYILVWCPPKNEPLAKLEKAC